MTLVLLSYIALAYTSMGVAVFVYLLAYYVSGPGSKAIKQDGGFGDCSPIVMVVAISILLLLCMLVWPAALRGHRKDLKRHRATAVWMWRV